MKCWLELWLLCVWLPMNSLPPKRDRIFISYSHNDEDRDWLVEKIKKMLDPLITELSFLGDRWESFWLIHL